MGARFRHRCAADLQHFAHLASRAHPLFRRSDGTLGSLRDRHRGQTCVIMGNGPSLAGVDVGKLAGVPAFCLNRGYLKWRNEASAPAYYVAVNDLVLEQFHGEISELGCPLFLPWEHHRLFQNTPDAVFIEMRWHRQFFGDVRSGLWPGGTVTFAAMQIAYHMGFSRVVLIGVDHRFQRREKAHSEIVQAGADTDHFVESYFDKGVRWNAPDLEQSEFAYRLARSAFEQDGREIVDATTGGALRVFRKMILEEALRPGG